MFGDNLKQIRYNRGLTLENLAALYNKKFDKNISKGTLSRYENGLQEPMMSVVRNLAEILGVSVSDLLGKNDNNFLKELNSAPNIQTVKEPDWEETFSKIKNLAARLQNPQLKNTVEAASAEISDMAKEIYKKQKELIKDFNLYIINSLNADGNLIAFEFLSKLEKNPKYTTPDEARTTSEQREKEE